MTKKVHSIFPIQQDPACLLKWAWSSVYLNNGSSSSCHHTKRFTIDPNDFGSFHNHPRKISARESMLKGQWPGDGCEYCQKVEDNNGESDRMYQLRALTDPRLVPPELSSNANAVSVTPTFLEVYFSNTCNMKCTYCGPQFSSAWVEENRKFNINVETQINSGYQPELAEDNPHYDQMVADLWKYLDEEQRYSTLRRFHILGGEPFLLSEMDQCIDFWREHPNPDLSISVITNLNIPHARFSKYIERFRELINNGKIMTVQIVASIDMWGKEQEFVRYGLDLNLLQQNFESIITDPIITCSINSTLSSLTIKKLPDLIEKINEWNAMRSPIAIDEYNRYISYSFNYANNAYNPFYFSGDVFRDDFKRALDLYPTESQMQRDQKKAMQGIADAHSKCTNNLEKINALKNCLDILDKRRGTCWKTTFPWLDKDFSV